MKKLEIEIAPNSFRTVEGVKTKLFAVEVTEIVAIRCTYYVEADTEDEAKRNAAEGVAIHDLEIEPDSGRGEREPLRRDVHSAKELPPLSDDYDGTF
jgi:hypothetical protein